MKETSVHAIMLVSWLHFSFDSSCRGNTKGKLLAAVLDLWVVVFVFKFSTDTS